MQIFRPYKNHKQTAKFLCDSRLNKQVIECSQVATSILNKLSITEGKAGWFNHPITQHIFNNGQPYLPDLFNYMTALNNEWIIRGKNRSAEFQSKLDRIGETILNNADKFNWDDMPPFYAFGEVREYNSNKVWSLYRELLYSKWQVDRVTVKASLNLRRIA